MEFWELTVGAPSPFISCVCTIPASSLTIETKNCLLARHASKGRVVCLRKTDILTSIGRCKAGRGEMLHVHIFETGRGK